MQISTVETSKNIVEITGREQLDKNMPLRSGEIDKKQSSKVTFGKDKVGKKIEELNEAIQAFQKDLRFKLHEKADMVMVEVFDLKKHEVIRTIPPKDLVEMHARIKEMVGILLDKNV